MRKISSIIPIRAQEFSFYKERLAVRENMDLSGIETIVVDDGSPADVASEIEIFCARANFVYKRLETSRLPFSLSRARNAGIDVASSEWIIMEDADVVYQHDFYNRMALEVDFIDESPFNFLTIPVIYLKENISKNVFSVGVVDDFIPEILSRFQFENPSGSEDNVVVESFAPASALFVVRKKLLNLAGGYDEYFVGWGGEDRDLAFRLLSINGKNDNLPTFFDVTKSWSLNKTYDYEGWRAFYRLTGDYLANKGIYGYHLYHPKLEWREKTDTKKNIDFAKEKAIKFHASRKIKPRYDKDKPVNIIIGYNPYLVNEFVLNALDNVCILDDDRNSSYLQTVDGIGRIKQVENIFFWNPFGSDWKLNLYRELKRLGYSVVVAERGALPDAYYFDDDGFCIESDSYKKFESVYEEYAEDYSLRAVELVSYMEDVRYGNVALERQAERIPVGLLRLRLNIDASKQILFCPLQLSTDTVTNYCVDEGRGYQNYLDEIRKLERYLPDDWVLVVKNHPLSVDKFSSEKSVIADDYHINDLLEASSAVALYNSGCGVLSMAFDKKVFYYGKCFYAIDGVNEKFASAETVFEALLKGDISVDKSKILKFYYFLRYHFYSYAQVENSVESTNGRMKNILKNIFYHDLKLPGRVAFTYKKVMRLNGESLLLGRYVKSINLQGKKLAPVVAANIENFPPAAVVPKRAPTGAAPAKTEHRASNSERVLLDFPQKDKYKNDLKAAGRKSSVFLEVYRLAASPFMTKRKRLKLDADPESFFRDSSVKVNRVIGKFIL